MLRRNPSWAYNDIYADPELSFDLSAMGGPS
jgi:hypothetical protein